MTDDHALIIVNAAEPEHGMQVGKVVLRTHGPDRCSGEFCVIHNPSDHHMVDWDLNWRADTYVMERLCPHGIGHPDPDAVAHDERQGRFSTGVHGCDGCCVMTAPEPLACCAHCGGDRPEHHGGHDKPCPKCAPDPLAGVLEEARRGTGTGEDGSTYVYFQDGAHLARIAREHIAAELRSAGFDVAVRVALGEAS